MNIQFSFLFTSSLGAIFNFFFLIFNFYFLIFKFFFVFSTFFWKISTFFWPGPLDSLHVTNTRKRTHGNMWPNHIRRNFQLRGYSSPVCPWTVNVTVTSWCTDETKGRFIWTSEGQISSNKTAIRRQLAKHHRSEWEDCSSRRHQWNWSLNLWYVNDIHSCV